MFKQFQGFTITNLNKIVYYVETKSKRIYLDPYKKFNEYLIGQIIHLLYNILCALFLEVPRKTMNQNYTTAQNLLIIHISIKMNCKFNTFHYDKMTVLNIK